MDVICFHVHLLLLKAIERRAHSTSYSCYFSPFRRKGHQKKGRNSKNGAFTRTSLWSCAASPPGAGHHTPCSCQPAGKEAAPRGFTFGEHRKGGHPPCTQGPPRCQTPGSLWFVSTFPPCAHPPARRVFCKQPKGDHYQEANLFLFRH